MKEYIAFYDSGVGGLSVLHEAMRALPHENFIYYSDPNNAPYGKKSKEEVNAIAQRVVTELAHHNLKALVVACNTATSVAIKSLRKAFDFPIIGMEPAVKPALTKDKSKVLLMATELTLNEDKLKNLISNLDAEERVTKIPMPELVEAAEEFRFDDDELRFMLEIKLATINWEEYSSIVLGCTHFIFFYPLLKKWLPKHIEIIDGNKGTINQLLSRIVVNSSGHQTLRCYLSGLEIDRELVEPYLRVLDSV